VTCQKEFLPQRRNGDTESLLCVFRCAFAPLREKIL